MNIISKQIECAQRTRRKGYWLGKISFLASVLVSAVLLVVGIGIYHAGLQRVEGVAHSWVEFMPLIAMGYGTLLLLAIAIVEVNMYRSRADSSDSRAAMLSEIVKCLTGKLEADRKSLSAQLHDDIGGGLTAVKLDVESLQRNQSMNEEDWNRCYARFDNLMQRVRGISRALYPSMIGVLGLSGVLREMVDQLKTGEVDIRLDISPDLRLPDEPLSVCILRTVQEAVVNAMRHSQAHQISICIMCDDDKIYGHVDDDGVGWQKSGEGMGLTLMRERIAGMNGTLDFVPSPNGGARVRFNVPMKTGSLVECLQGLKLSGVEREVV